MTFSGVLGGGGRQGPLELINLLVLDKKMCNNFEISFFYDIYHRYII